MSPLLPRILVAAALLPSLALAEGKPEAPPPSAVAKPGPEIDRLKFLVGNFACDVTSRGAGGAEQASKTKFAGKWSLGNFFVAFQDVAAKESKPARGAKKESEGPASVERDGYFGFAPGLGRYVFAAFDSTGGSLFLRAESPGDVDQLTFKGTVDEGKRHIPVTWSFTRTEKGFRLLAERTNEEGEAQKQLEESCVRGK